MLRLLKVADRGVVILQTGVVVKAFGEDGLAKIGLKRERGFSCVPCLFTQASRWLKPQRDVAGRVDV